VGPSAQKPPDPNVRAACGCAVCTIWVSSRLGMGDIPVVGDLVSCCPSTLQS
jgi:hypothetical protein